MRKDFWFLAFFIFIFIHTEVTYSQNVDSLFNKLKIEKVDSLKIRILEDLVIELRSKDTKKSLELCVQAMEIAKNTKNKELIGLVYQMKGSVYAANFEYENSLKYYLAAYKIFKVSNNIKYMSSSASNIGSQHRYLSNFDSAVYYYNISMQMKESIADSVGIYRLCNNLGLIYRTQTLYDKAMLFFQRCYTGFESLGDKKSMAAPLQNIGNIHYSLHNYHKALEYYQKALVLKQETGDLNGIADLNTNMGSIYMNMNNYPRALEMLNQSVDMYLQLGNKPRLAHVYDNIGDVYLKMNNLKMANTYIQKGLEIRRDVGNPIELAYSLNNLGHYFILAGLPQKAIEALNEAITSTAKAGALASQAEATKYLSLAYEKLGNHKKSLEIYKTYKQLNDSANLSENSEKLVQLEMQHDFDKKMRVIENEQQNKNLEYQHQLKIHRWRMIGAIFTILILSILAFLMYRVWTLGKRNIRILSEHNQVNQSKNEELIQQQAQIIRQRNDLEKLNATKDKFFSIIAHDLKNPFMTINGFTELLIRDSEKCGHPPHLEIARLIHATSKNTFTLLENLLQWARSQTNELKTYPEKIDLVQLIHNNIDLFSENAKLKKINISYYGLPGVFIQADQNMLDSIIRNLISNAIKFTPENGEIRVSALINNDKVTFSVEDNGVGMYPEQVDGLFKIEKMHTTEGTNHEMGTGLGLLICHEFILKNDGSISVESEMEKGSKFNVTFPTIS